MNERRRSPSAAKLTAIYNPDMGIHLIYVIDEYGRVWEYRPHKGEWLILPPLPSD